MMLNGDYIKWFSDIEYLRYHFNSFKKDTKLRKGQFIQCVNEICTEFAFSHLINVNNTSGCTVSEILNEYNVDFV